MELKCIYVTLSQLFCQKSIFTCACFNYCLQNSEHPDFPKVLQAALDIGKVSLVCIFIFFSSQFVLEFFKVFEFVHFNLSFLSLG